MNTSKNPQRNRIFAYHATLKEFVPLIARDGLIAHFDENLGEDVIFVEPDESEAAIYLQDNGAMLRVSVDGIGDTEDGECVLWDTPRIAPSDIDIRDKQEWVHLSDFSVTSE
jgi:hypothetical protein